MLTLNIIMGYYIGHEEGMIIYAFAAHCTCVYAQSTMCACAVYTNTTTFQPLVACL